MNILVFVVVLDLQDTFIIHLVWHHMLSFFHVSSLFLSIFCLPPPQALWFQSQNRWIQSKPGEPGGQACKGSFSFPLPFPSSLAQPPLWQRERHLGMRQIFCYLLRNLALMLTKKIKTYGLFLGFSEVNMIWWLLLSLVKHVGWLILMYVH